MASSDSSEGWRRPEDFDRYPHEWDRFEGLRPMPDGTVPRFWIRNVTADAVEDCVAYMHANYMRQEQMAVASGAADDPQSSADMEGMWRDAFTRQRVSLAAFTDWPDGDEHLAGINVLGVIRKEDPPMKMPGVATGPMFVLMNEMLAAASVFRRYGVSRYLIGLGLSVAPEFRGQNIGLRLLQAREPLCKALHLPLTITAFSGPQSQKQSERAGFEVLESRLYAHFVLEDGRCPFADTTWPKLELKAKFYGPRDDDQ